MVYVKLRGLLKCVARCRDARSAWAIRCRGSVRGRSRATHSSCRSAPGAGSCCASSARSRRRARSDEVKALLAQAAQFHEDRLIVHVVLREVPHDLAPLAALAAPPSASSPTPTERSPIGAATACTMVLDPMLHCVANIPLDHPNGHAAMLRNVIACAARGRCACGRAAVRARPDRAARVRVCLLRAAGALLRGDGRRRLRLPARPGRQDADRRSTTA